MPASLARKNVSWSQWDFCHYKRVQYFPKFLAPERRRKGGGRRRMSRPASQSKRFLNELFFAVSRRSRQKRLEAPSAHPMTRHGVAPATPWNRYFSTSAITMHRETRSHGRKTGRSAEMIKFNSPKRGSPHHHREMGVFAWVAW